MKRVPPHLAGMSLFTAATAWTLQQTAGYVVASWRCFYDQLPIWLLTGMALLLIGAGVWASAQVFGHGFDQSDMSRPRHFLGVVALMAAPLFLFAILLQAAAALYLPGCVG
jgi:hypothetical protein